VVMVVVAVLVLLSIDRVRYSSLPASAPCLPKLLSCRHSVPQPHSSGSARCSFACPGRHEWAKLKPVGVCRPTGRGRHGLGGCLNLRTPLQSIHRKVFFDISSSRSISWLAGLQACWLACRLVVVGPSDIVCIIIIFVERLQFSFVSSQEDLRLARARRG